MNRILIIDDDRQLGQSFAKILSQEGYDTANAFTGREGIELARSYRPSLAIGSGLFAEQAFAEGIGGLDDGVGHFVGDIHLLQ